SLLLFYFSKRYTHCAARRKPALVRAAKTKALIEPHQMRRGVCMCALAGGLQHCAQERARRAFAVRTSDMDHRWQLALWMTERGEQPLDAIERQVDALGMQRGQPLDDGIDRVHCLSSRSF